MYLGGHYSAYHPILLPFASAGPLTPVVTPKVLLGFPKMCSHPVPVAHNRFPLIKFANTQKASPEHGTNVRMWTSKAPKGSMIQQCWIP